MAVAYSETMNGVEGKPVLIIQFRPGKKNSGQVKQTALSSERRIITGQALSVGR